MLIYVCICLFVRIPVSLLQTSENSEAYHLENMAECDNFINLFSKEA